MTRPRLQLHLSTLLIVSLLVAGLVWLNITPHTYEVRESAENHWLMQANGWPFAYSYRQLDAAEFPRRKIVPSSMLIDAILCLALLTVAAVAIEWATRRMKRQ